MISAMRQQSITNIPAGLANLKMWPTVMDDDEDEPVCTDAVLMLLKYRLKQGLTTCDAITFSINATLLQQRQQERTLKRPKVLQEHDPLPLYS
jgi:hypothetical protein